MILGLEEEKAMGSQTMGRVTVAATIENLDDVDCLRRGFIRPD